MGKVPVFVSSNLTSSAETLGDLLGRFDVYGRKLRELSGGETQKLFVLGGFGISEEKYKRFTHLELIRVGKGTRNFIIFGLQSLNRLRQMNIQPNLLVAADLYASFLSAIVIRGIMNPEIGIQVSFHGTFRNSADGILKSRIRKRYLRFVVSRCSSIRVVSKELSEELALVYDLKNIEICIAPIPVSVSNSKVRLNRSKVITFAGRIHNERGLDHWVSIIRNLSEFRDDFKCLVIGDGAESKFFQGELAKILPANKLRFTGKLVNSEVLTEFHSASILLSTAPSEGFGLAVREAMTAGARVCAFSTPGLTQLERDFPNLISTFQTEKEGANVLNELLNTEIKMSEVLSFRRYLENENRNNLNNLVLSWLN